MKIIIVGNGKVGYAIANSLAQEDHDIIMVDASTSGPAESGKHHGRAVRGGQRRQHQRAGSRPASATPIW